MSNFATLFGGGGSSGAPIGSYAAGALDGNPDYLPLDGRIYSKAAYPNLDTSKMLTFGSNTLVTRQTLSNGTYNRIESAGGLVVASPTGGASTTYYTSADDGTTWTNRTFPVVVSGWVIGFANNIWFGLKRGAASSVIYTSPDCITWTARSMPTSNYWCAVGYIGNQYVVVPNNVANTFYFSRSTDLATWTNVVTSTVLGIGAGTNFFTPDKPSLLNHPALGLVFSVTVNGQTGNVIVVNTPDGIYQSTAYAYSEQRSATSVLTTCSVVADDCGMLVAESDTVGVVARGSSTSSLFVGDYSKGNSSTYRLRRGRKNLMCPQQSGIPVLASHDFGRSGIQHELDSGSFSTMSPTRLIACTPSGVIKTVDIDTTKFAAVLDTFNFQDFQHPTYIKVR